MEGEKIPTAFPAWTWQEGKGRVLETLHIYSRSMRIMDA
jgi:hypothetical protein